jgi:hypothetical protein
MQHIHRRKGVTVPLQSHLSYMLELRFIMYFYFMMCIIFILIYQFQCFSDINQYIRLLILVMYMYIFLYIYNSCCVLCNALCLVNYAMIDIRYTFYHFRSIFIRVIMIVSLQFSFLIELKWNHQIKSIEHDI